MKIWARSEIDALVEGFHQQSLRSNEWTHQAHLIVGLYYAIAYSKEETICLLRAAIILLNASMGIPNTTERGYHETLTRFWIEEIYQYLKQQPSNQNLEDLVNDFLSSSYGRSDYPLRFYTKDQIYSLEARATYILPTKG